MAKHLLDTENDGTQKIDLMQVLTLTDLVSENNEILTQECPEWDFENPPEDSQSLAARMYMIMRTENGIGLAAPQIGHLYRVFVMGDQESMWVCFNPEITSKSEEETVDVEGCLSFPGLYFKVKRANEIGVRYKNASGEVCEEQLTGIWSRCFQHELDHLNGICYTNRVGKTTLDLARKRRSKSLKGKK